MVINAARGGHQREADIVRAINDGTLKAASLDVFEVEPLPQDSPLWAMDNVYITPHDPPLRASVRAWRISRK